MAQLSGLDGGFLAMETPSGYGGVCIVEARVSRGIESRLTLEHFTRFVATRAARATVQAPA